MSSYIIIFQLRLICWSLRIKKICLKKIKLGMNQNGESGFLTHQENQLDILRVTDRPKGTMMDSEIWLFNKICGDHLEAPGEIQVYNIKQFEGVRATEIRKLFVLSISLSNSATQLRRSRAGLLRQTIYLTFRRSLFALRIFFEEQDFLA